MADDRLNMRLDSKTLARLAALVSHLELKRPDVVRLAIRALAEREGVEPDVHDG